MLSRKTVYALANVYQAVFTYNVRVGTTTRLVKYVRKIKRDSLYDFLFQHDQAAWLCNSAKKLFEERSILEWVMQLHTGETQYAATKEWSWEDRQKLGQRILRNLAEDILSQPATVLGTDDSKRAEQVEQLMRLLELDGYIYRDGKLLVSEADVLNTEEELGVLRSLFERLSLDNGDTAFHHLRLSEEHYTSEKWDDSIANSRKFLEAVLQSVAAAHCLRMTDQPLGSKTYSRPGAVRDYLEREGLLENREKSALAEIYGLLSHTGGHPYMAQADQARLLRYMALTFSQFVMLRLLGKLSGAANPQPN